MFTQELLERSIGLYQDGHPMLKVCATTGINLSSLQRHLQKRGLSRNNKQNSRRYHVNHSYFKSIDTEDKAYWLGFLYADGYVSNRKNKDLKIGIALGIEDISHLEKAKQCFNATYPINTYKSTCFDKEVTYGRLLMSSDEMFHDLVKKGMVEHKTLVLDFPSPDIVPNHLVKHFIRGYFDGDGGFSKVIAKPGTFRVHFCGTQEFLAQTLDHIGFPDVKLYQRWQERNNNNFYFQIGGMRQVKTVACYLYEDATIYLDRKYELYKQIIAYQGRKMTLDQSDSHLPEQSKVIEKPL